jgi:hypothetical protein
MVYTGQSQEKNYDLGVEKGNPHLLWFEPSNNIGNYLGYNFIYLICFLMVG